MEPKARVLRRGDPLSVVLSLLLRHPTDKRGRPNSANGERSVELVIGRLPEGWHASSNPLSDHGTDVVHVVVGPAGTFVLNARNLIGKVWVGAGSVRHNGHPTNFLSKTAQDASRASLFLTAAVGRPVAVRGVVAILADGWTIEEKPAEVHVGSPRGVKDWLLRLPATLAPHEVMEIAAAVNEPSTWRNHPVAPA